MNNTTYAINLLGGGQHYFSSDSSGSELQDDFTTVGTITAAGFSLNVNQRHYFVLEAATQVATSAQDTINSALTINGDTYQWANVFKRKDFTDGKPVHFDPSATPLYWEASGSVLKNGAAFANYAYYPVAISPNASLLQFLLQTPTDSLVVESWPVTAN
jgi:hypothetical protein